MSAVLIFAGFDFAEPVKFINPGVEVSFPLTILTTNPIATPKRSTATPATAINLTRPV